MGETGSRKQAFQGRMGTLRFRMACKKKKNWKKIQGTPLSVCVAWSVSRVIEVNQKEVDERWASRRGRNAVILECTDSSFNSSWRRKAEGLEEILRCVIQRIFLIGTCAYFGRCHVSECDECVSGSYALQ